MEWHARAKDVCLHNVVVKLLRNDMARSTAASAGQYVRNSARTGDALTHCACTLSGAMASHILDIYKLAKRFTMCSLRYAHSTKARSQCTCAPSDAMKRRNSSTPYGACSLRGRASKRPRANNIAHSSSPLGSSVACASLMPASKTLVTACAVAPGKGGVVAYFCQSACSCTNCTPCHAPVMVCSLNCN